MRHLRDAIITIAGILAMYWTAIRLSHAFWPWLQSSGWENPIWFDRVINFSVALLVGATLMTLLKWRFRVVVIIAIPTVVALAYTYLVYAELRAYGAEIYSEDLVPMALFQGITFVLGLLAGSMLCRLFQTRATPSTPNTSQERTREG
jgi:hypothetical protein